MSRGDLARLIPAHQPRSCSRLGGSRPIARRKIIHKPALPIVGPRPGSRRQDPWQPVERPSSMRAAPIASVHESAFPASTGLLPEAAPSGAGQRGRAPTSRRVAQDRGGRPPRGVGRRLPKHPPLPPHAIMSRCAWRAADSSSRVGAGRSTVALAFSTELGKGSQRGQRAIFTTLLGKFTSDFGFDLLPSPHIRFPKFCVKNFQIRPSMPLPHSAHGKSPIGLGIVRHVSPQGCYAALAAAIAPARSFSRNRGITALAP